MATFKRSLSLGLVLSEAGGDIEDEEDERGAAAEEWERATENAHPGEVFVKEVAKGGQADEMQIFEVGAW